MGDMPNILRAGPRKLIVSWQGVWATSMVEFSTCGTVTGLPVAIGNAIRSSGRSSSTPTVTFGEAETAYGNGLTHRLRCGLGRKRCSRLAMRTPRGPDLTRLRRAARLGSGGSRAELIVLLYSAEKMGRVLAPVQNRDPSRELHRAPT